jgi:FKBP12-rapamycin complex-associated protein
MFQCVGMLASAVGPNLTKLLHDQLDLMFACGLSEPLHHALIEIAKNIPPLLKTIQGMLLYILVYCDLISWPDRLLDMLSIILSDKPYKPLGAPPVLIRGNVSTISRDLNASQVGWVFCNIEDELNYLLEQRDNKERANYLGSHYSR